MEERRRSLARMRARKEKRREFGAQGNAPDLYQPELGYGSDTGSGSISANGSWESMVEKGTPPRHQSRERSHRGGRSGRMERRGRKGLHISNPDIHEEHNTRDGRERRDHHKEHSGGRPRVAPHDVDQVDWSGGSPTLAYNDEFGMREDGHQTDVEVLTYTYRQR